MAPFARLLRSRRRWVGLVVRFFWTAGCCSMVATAVGGNATTTTTTTAREYLYALNGDPNASFPVQEYMTGGSASSITVDGIWNGSTTDDGDYHMVEFYQPYCEACKVMQQTYRNLVTTVQQHMDRSLTEPTTTRSKGSSSSKTFQAHAISCAAHPQLCLDIENYPTFRVYKPDGSVHDIHIHHLHPYTLLEKLNITYSRRSISPLDADELGGVVAGDDDSFAQELFATYNAKRVDLDQDSHIGFEVMLRNNVFQARNLNQTTENTRDPPLKATSTIALRLWLELLIRTATPYTRLHRTVKELLESFVYVANHGGYLPMILDEFTTESGGYSNDCGVTTDFGSAYFCSLWKLLFSMVQGLTDYNAVAPSPEEEIPVEQFVSIVQEFAMEVGMSLTPEELGFFMESVPQPDTPDESPAMQLALWISSLRNKVQYSRMRHQKALLRQREMGSDVLQAQWPNRELCPACWNAIPRKNRVNNIRPVLWNDQIVFKYIQLENYFNGSLSATATPTSLLRLYKKVHPEKFDPIQHDGSEL